MKLRTTPWAGTGEKSVRVDLIGSLLEVGRWSLPAVSRRGENGSRSLSCENRSDRALLYLRNAKAGRGRGRCGGIVHRLVGADVPCSALRPRVSVHVGGERG